MKEFDVEIELNRELKEKRYVLEIMAMVLKDPDLIYIVEYLKLNDMFRKMTFNEKITNKQYKELSNMIKDFKNTLNDYIKENDIDIEME